MCCRGGRWSLVNRLLLAAVPLALLLVFGAYSSNAVHAQGEEISPPFHSDPVEPVIVNLDPADLIKVDPTTLKGTVPEGVNSPPLLPASGPRPEIVDPYAQMTMDTDYDSIDLMSDALSFAATGSPQLAGINTGSGPPDTVGDIGPNHFVQMTNSTPFQIWDKDGNVLQASTAFGSLWPAGDACNSSLGDPIVVYDHLADRWLLSQFAQNTAQTMFWMCIAISRTPDPTVNSWNLYTIQVAAFPDYPKFGVWPDGYYMSTYEGSNLGVFVFERDQMLNGNAASFFKFTISSLSGSVRDTRILPADLDGPPPPIGTPNYFVRTVDDQQDAGDPTDRVEVYEFSVDWNNSNASFALVDTIAPAPFDTMACNRNGQGIRDCIPQPNSDDTIDALSNRPMMQLKYRNFGTHEAMVFNQAVDVSDSLPNTLPFAATQEVAGVRWYELRKGGANWAIEQEGTYAPQPITADSEDDLIHRWMGSAAMDKDGNIAIGYSVVSPSTDNNFQIFPSLRFAGRSAADQPGRLPQGEKSIFAGTVPQGNNDGAVTPQRWGDYSALSVDPVDDCTFWFTSHVSNGETNRTWISKFRFPSCSQTDLSITKTDTPDPVAAGGQLTYDITVRNNGDEIATNVGVTDTLPIGVSYVTDSDSCVLNPSTGPAGEDQLFCDLGDLGPGNETSFTIVVTVDPNLVANNGGQVALVNTAVVDADQADPDESNNTASASTVVIDESDVQVTKECKPDRPLNTGEEGTCFITVTNLGPSTARNVTLVDTHVSNGVFTIVSATPSAGACNVTPNPQNGTGTVDCTLGEIAPNGVVTVDVVITADTDQDVNDQVQVASDTPDTNLQNNSASDGLTFVGVADLALTKTGNPNPVVAGTQLTYDLEVTNNGPDTAHNVVIEDVLPQGVSIDSVNSPAGTCNAGIPGDAGAPTTCTVDSLAPLASATMQVVVTVQPQTLGILGNNAKVFSDVPDPDNSNNLATTATTVNGDADLSVTKSDDPDPVLAGTELTYELNVTNNGPSTAVDVELTDELPNEVSYLSATISNGTGTCVQLAVPPNTIACDLNDLNPGEFVTVYIEVLVDASVPDGTVIQDTASVSSATLDSNAANDSATEDTTVNAEADLEILKDGNLDTTSPENTIVFSIDVVNHGPSDALTVVMTDTLPLQPPQINYVFDTGNGACAYDEPSHTVSCDFGTVAAEETASVLIYVQASGSVREVTNTAEVTTSTADPNLANNTAVKELLIKGGSDRPGTVPGPLGPAEGEVRLRLPFITK